MFFNLLEKVGTIGKYQKITLIFWSLACYLCGGFVLITPFLFFQDPYTCPASIDPASCTNYVCNLPADHRQPYIPENSMMTLADKLGDYRCNTEAATLSLAISFIYASTIFGYVVLCVLGDYMGRKKIVVAGLVLMVAGITISLFAEELFVAAAGLFLGFVGIQWAFSISFIFISETVAESYR
jgi:MFS family permease